MIRKMRFSGVNNMLVNIKKQPSKSHQYLMLTNSLYFDIIFFHILGICLYFLTFEDFLINSIYQISELINFIVE